MDHLVFFLNKQRGFYYILFLLFASPWTNAQKKTLELHQIYEQNLLRPASVSGFNFMKDGLSFSRKSADKIIKFDLASGSELEVIFDAALVSDGILKGKLEGYQFSSDEQKILLLSASQSLYRYSSFVDCYVYDRIKKSLIRIFPEGKIMYPSLSPSGNQIAFIFENNIYIQDLQKNKRVQVTKDGAKNNIINGASDWVYEEEFVLTRAFEWSPDGTNILFLKTNESRVREFSIEYFKDQVYPEIYKFKYPKVGEENAELSVWNYSLKTKKSKMLPVGSVRNGENGYIPRIQWSANPQEACIRWMNRDQNLTQLHLVNVSSAKSRLLFEEKNKYYIEVHDDLHFKMDGSSFYWMSEMDGENAMFEIGMDGKIKRRITPGGKELTEFYGFSEDHKYAYFQAATERGLERQIYRVNIDGSGLTSISKGPGTHAAQFSVGAKLFVHSFSQINSPPIHQICDATGQSLRILEDNQKLIKTLESFKLSAVEMTTIYNRNQEALNALMIKPADFDPTKKYPVLMYLYGGPGSQEVMNKWNSFRYYPWLQMIAQKGYVIVVVDNRGTGGRGEAFKKCTYKRLGELETEDQIDAAKYLASLSFIDGNRIGIFGWSYGGYMSSLCILKGNDVFKSAIAVAPVTNWKWYDSVYTERYNGTETNNAQAYKDHSPVYFADLLKGNYLLVHGMADDNVHFQNTAEMVNALVKSKKQFDTYFYPNRHHGIRGDNATIHLFTKMTQFVYEKI